MQVREGALDDVGDASHSQRPPEVGAVTAGFLAVGGGVVLGALSRVEEVTHGFSAGISSNSMWLAAAFAVGALRRSPWQAGLLGAVLLTVANASYYGWVLVTEPGVSLSSVAGSPTLWFALGLAGGAVLGLAGALWRFGGPAARLGGGMALAAVLVVEGADALGSGPATDAIGIVVGFAVGVSAAAPSRRRVSRAVAALSALTAVAATGALAPLLP